jgi:hypothetical protein
METRNGIFWSRSVKKRLGDLLINGRIILKWVSEKWSVDDDVGQG